MYKEMKLTYKWKLKKFENRLRSPLKSKINISAHGFSAKAKSSIEDLGGKVEVIEKKKSKAE